MDIIKKLKLEIDGISGIVHDYNFGRLYSKHNR